MRLHVGGSDHLGVDVLVEGEHFPPSSDLSYYCELQENKVRCKHLKRV